MENRISGNAFHLTVKIKALTRKSFYVSIFTSNHFQTQTCKERERETVSLHRLSSSLKTYTPSIHPRWVSFSPIHPSVRSTPYFTLIHPKLNSSSTHPRPSSFVEQCPKHRQVVPSNFVVPSIFSCSNSTRNPKNPFLKPTPTNPPLRWIHSANSSNPHWPPPISLSLCHLSPSLTLHCFCDFFVLIFFSLIVYIFWFSVIIYV